ncbi:MAG: crcB 1, partial [Frankiales bacterium]|nr:crcB 1 [Frankiales bacterium]
RYGVVQAWPDDGSFPWAVLVINCSGAFLLGALLVAAPPERVRLRALLGTGLLGAWTTFSAIVVSVDQLVADGHPATALAYLLASACGGLCAAWLGLRAGRRLC